MNTIRLILAVAAAAFFATACSKSHDHAKTSSGHVHVAPHGGVLVEIGDHAYNLELLRDRTAGKLTARVLDADAENFVRLLATSFQLIAMPGGQ